MLPAAGSGCVRGVSSRPPPSSSAAPPAASAWTPGCAAERADAGSSAHTDTAAPPSAQENVEFSHSGSADVDQNKHLGSFASSHLSVGLLQVRGQPLRLLADDITQLLPGEVSQNALGLVEQDAAGQQALVQTVQGGQAVLQQTETPSGSPSRTQGGTEPGPSPLTPAGGCR